MVMNSKSISMDKQEAIEWFRKFLNRTRVLSASQEVVLTNYFANQLDDDDCIEVSKMYFFPDTEPPEVADYSD